MCNQYVGELNVKANLKLHKWPKIQILFDFVKININTDIEVKQARLYKDKYEHSLTGT